MDTRERREFGKDQIPAALAYLEEADVLIAHNGQRYDVPLLIKLYGFKPKGIVRDTMIIARLIYPNVKDTDKALIQKGSMPASGYQGKHTIAAWGYRLGVPKLHEDITEWSEWTAQIQERCVGDVTSNLELWDHLKADAYSQDAIDLEHRIAVVCSRMEEAGVPFNQQKAGALHADLVQKKEEVEKALVAQFGFWLQPISPDPSKYEVMPKVNNATRGVTKGEPFCKLKKVTFNPGSRDHIIRVLSLRGWKTTKFTQGGKAEIDENAIEGIVQAYPEMAGLGEYMMLDKRLSQLADGKRALIRSVAEDGRIHGVINPMGTTTSRAAHFSPNLGQVPSSKKPYGDRFRALFEVPAGWVLVGADMEGLEGRGFAHFMFPVDQGRYATALLSGDPHWASAKYLAFITNHEERDKHNRLHVVLREGAKRFYYAFIYGAWDQQCGSIILDTCNDAKKEGFPQPYLQFFGNVENPGEALLKRVGGKARNDFISKTPGMEALKAKLSKQVDKHHWVPGLDGRRVPVRSDHSALNFLIQCAGAILCKRWVCDAYDEIVSKYRWGWGRGAAEPAGDFVFCLWVHDEIQVACREGLETEIGEIIVKHARGAGEPYGFRLPLDSKYSVGKDWSTTH